MPPLGWMGVTRMPAQVRVGGGKTLARPRGGTGDIQTGAGDTTDPDGKDTEEPTDPQGGDDKDDKPVVDPAFEESKQTCIATCGLKCKSESSDKKDACIDLCFN